MPACPSCDIPVPSNGLCAGCKLIDAEFAQFECLSYPQKKAHTTSTWVGLYRSKFETYFTQKYAHLNATVYCHSGEVRVTMHRTLIKSANNQ